MGLANRAVELSEWEVFASRLDDVSQDEEGTPQQPEPACQEQGVVRSQEEFGDYVPPTEEAANEYRDFFAFLEERNTTHSSIVEDSNDSLFTSLPPVKSDLRTPPRPPINYGHSVSYLPPTGSRDQTNPRPPTYDNVTIPPHLIPIIQPDAFDLAIKTSSVLIPPPRDRDYNLLGAWYTAANDLAAGRVGKGNCTTFLHHKAYYDSLALTAQRGSSTPSHIPAEVPFSNGVELVAIDGSLAQHIALNNCSHCLIHAFRTVQERKRIEKGVAVRLQQDKLRTAEGGINRQVRRRCRDDPKKKKMSPEARLRLSNSAPVPSVGAGDLPSEYAKAFERWDAGMQKTMPGYAGSERRRAWCTRRDQGVW